MFLALPQRWTRILCGSIGFFILASFIDVVMVVIAIAAVVAAGAAGAAAAARSHRCH